MRPAQIRVIFATAALATPIVVRDNPTPSAPALAPDSNSSPDVPEKAPETPSTPSDSGETTESGTSDSDSNLHAQILKGGGGGGRGGGGSSGGVRGFAPYVGAGGHGHSGAVATAPNVLSAAAAVALVYALV